MMASNVTTADNDLADDLDSLTILQRRFVEEMMVSPNASTAYRRAGGTARTDGAVYYGAHELLRNPNVSRVLRKMRDRRGARTQVDVDWVVGKLLDVLERCLQETPVYDADGEPTGEYKFDSVGATKALNMLMKHTGGYDKDNRQKQVKDPDALRERLKQMGMDPERLRALPGGN